MELKQWYLPGAPERQPVAPSTRTVSVLPKPPGRLVIGKVSGFSGVVGLSGFVGLSGCSGSVGLLGSSGSSGSVGLLGSSGSSGSVFSKTLSTLSNSALLLAI